MCVFSVLYVRSYVKDIHSSGSYKNWGVLDIEMKAAGGEKYNLQFHHKVKIRGRCDGEKKNAKSSPN